MPIVNRLIFLLAACLLFSCSHLRSVESLPEIPLLPPNAMPSEQQITQQVNIEYQNKQQTLIAAWVIEKGVLTFVGVTPTGQRLATLTYDGKNFTESYSELVTEPIPGREVITHLQLAHWPESVINESLASTRWRVRFVKATREVYLGRKLVMTIYRDESPGLKDAPPRSIKVVSEVIDYQLNVKTL